MIIHTIAFVTSVVEHWLEQEIAQGFYHDNAYHSLCYTSCRELAGTGNNLNGSTMIIHTTAFVTPVVENWLEQEITSMGLP